MDQEEYPKSKKSSRIKQPKTLESKPFHTFPGMGAGTFVKHFFQLDLPLRVPRGVPKALNEEPAHSCLIQIVLLCFAMASNRVLWLVLTSPAV
jgi:hypothetical protein